MKPTRTVPWVAVLITATAIMTLISCSKNEPPPTATTPTVTTDAITAITQTSATGGGNVTSGGGITVKARGVCWSTNPAPTTASGKTSDSTGTGTYTSTLTGLLPNTTYYVRAYATNNLGTAYGNEQVFTTLPVNPGTVTDIDGNVYHIVTIGTQEWLAENLKAVRYDKGDSIPNVQDALEWGDLKKGAYCNYDKNPVYAPTYGRLYNWFAVNSNLGLCPEGWHVPSDTEWQTLIDYLGGEGVAGGKLKATGTLGQGTGLWMDPNTGATNESGFSALPAGLRNDLGNFSLLAENACFWSSTADLANAWNRELSFKYGTVERYSRSQNNGYSIRCIKDN